MVVFSAASMFLHDYSCQQILGFFSAAGLDGIEFWPETPDFWQNGQDIKHLKELKKARPELASWTIHAPILDMNPSSFNPGVAEISVGYAVKAVELAHDIGAQTVTIHPGRRTAKRPPTEADLNLFDHYMECVHETSRTLGVTVCIENMEPAVNSLAYTPERLREILDAEPWLGFTLDVAHAQIKDEMEPSRYIDLCGDRLLNVHMSRVVRNRPHSPISEDPAIAEIIRHIKSTGFSGSLTLEIEDLTFDHVMTAEEKVEVLAQDCRFMRDCWAGKFT